MGKLLVIKDADFSSVAVAVVTPGGDTPAQEVWYWQPSVDFGSYSISYPNLATCGRAVNDSVQNRLRGRVFNTIKFRPGKRGSGSGSADPTAGQIRIGKAKLNGAVTVIATINTTLEEYGTLVTRTIPETTLESDEYLVVGINGDTIDACGYVNSAITGYGWYGSIGINAAQWDANYVEMTQNAGGYIDVGFVPQT